MNSNIQKYIAIVVIALVVILIGLKLVTNYQTKHQDWEPEDRQKLIDQCLEDLQGRSIRFPAQSLDYCQCSTDTLMKIYTKGEYQQLSLLTPSERRENIVKKVLKCYNDYQEAMFDASSLD
jgi:hypothetical protein